jgi:murein DD-endopeptidase MepM/ murein hydrolase activator NlpD
MYYIPQYGQTLHKEVFQMEENNKSKKVNLLRKEGFYVIIFLCFCVAAITVVYRLGNNASTTKNTSKNIAGINQIKNNTTGPAVTQNKDNAKMTSKQQVKSVKDVAQKKSKTKKLITKKSTKLSTVKNFKLSYPVKGNITKKFDNKELQYSKAMGQWETHEGIDIVCDLGAQVKAAFAGKVIEVIKTEDTLTALAKDGFGDGIIIDHVNGYRTEYLNLANESLKLKKGDLVKAGQTIGNIGDTSLREDIAIEGSHLHFALLKKSGKEYLYVNPQNLLK